MEYLLTRISVLKNVGIFRIEKDEVQSYQEHGEFNPVVCSVELRNFLIHGADTQTDPYIYKDEYGVYFACMQTEETHYLVGPMSIRLLERVELHQFYRKYGMVLKRVWYTFHLQRSWIL